MDKNDIINYVMHTPHNTNKAVLSDMLNQLTEGGGGGSSDFSTANVTITSGGGRLILPIIQDLPEYPAYSGIYPFCELESGDKQVTVPLYKGVAWFQADNDITISALSGDIVSDGDGYYKITGDCSFTITGA